MPLALSSYQVADLCLGKPPLRSVSASATVADALAVLKSDDDAFVSVWSCDHSVDRDLDCVCVGKLCMVDVICFLCREENLFSPTLALKSPLSLLMSGVKCSVTHVDPSASLVEAIDLMIEGAQNLVVPIRSGISRRKLVNRSSMTIHNGEEFCWLTQEDVLRFLLSSIGLFSDVAPLPIETLGIITTDFLSVEFHRPALSAIKAISRSLADQTSVAVVDGEGILIGEISPLTLACSDETAAAAILTLSAGELMAYIDGGSPREEVARAVEERLKEKKLEGMLKEVMISRSSSGEILNSSDEEEVSYRTTTFYRPGRRAEAVVCHGRSSLAAVMIQAITHRVNYMWVVEEDDCSVIGIVTYANILDVLREQLESI